MATHHHPPAYDPRGCYIGAGLELDAAGWHLVLGDTEVTDEIARLLNEFDEAFADTEFDEDAFDRLDEINGHLRSAFGRAARLAMN